MRLKILTAAAAILLSWALAGCEAEQVASAEDVPPRSESKAATKATERGGDAKPREGHDRAKKPKPEPKPKPKPKPPARTWLVTRVIDGDTIELGNGAGVRIVGIDTPERGECGYDAATANMERLVLGQQVRLTMSDEDTDRYGRWLRYVNIGPIDAGLRQIKDGFAIARYDSRDGYGFHKREPIYIRTDKANKNLSCPKPAPSPAAPAGGGCAPGYTPCVPPTPPTWTAPT